MKAEIREIWALRRDGYPAAALDRALEVVESHWQDSDMFWGCWYEHFAGSRCLLLDFARATRSEPDSCARGLEQLERWADTRQDTLGEFLTQRLKRRIDLLQKVQLEDRGTAALVEALREAASACAMDFLAPGDAEEQETTRSEEAAGAGIVFDGESDQMARGLPENDSRPLPAFLRRLQPRDKWFDILAALGQELGWRNPGLLMVGEILAYVYGSEAPTPVDRDVFKTWVLLAGKNARLPTGTLAQLRLRRLNGGCGGFFPDPIAAGYLQLEDDFKAGLLHAWEAAFGDRSVGFDVAWSLDLIDADHSMRSLPIGGRSAEAAICCGLRAVAADQQLDQRVAVTASLSNHGQTGILLAPVGAIEDKTLAKPLVRKKITEIVVSAEQTEIVRNHGREVEIASGEIRLIPASDVNDAYQRLVRWERITSHVRQQLAAAAKQLIEELCGHYVVPSLSRPVLRQADSPRAPEEAFEALSKENVAELLDGRLKPGDRILLLAHSGMGKSVLLIESQRRMAQRSDGPLPVRLVGLSEFPWSDPVQARRRMADALARFLPKDVSESERWDWFERLVVGGQVVFLLDALDQTIVEKLDGMASFLANNIGECPILMTGRPYVTETRQAVLSADSLASDRTQRQWSHMRLDKFDESQQREFLGQWAEEMLYTEEEKVSILIGGDIFSPGSDWRSEHIPRKTSWADLVDQPLLSKMLRDLAAAQRLSEVTNRYGVYRKAVAQLIDKGWQSLRKSESERIFDSQSRLERALRQIAWNRAEANDFQGVLSGEELDELMTFVSRGLTSIREFELRVALDQMNIVTCGGIIESGQETQLAWRHLSFCEYFAGLELARGYPLQRMIRPPGGTSYDRHPENQHAAAVQSNARSQAWHWVFRFALSQLATSDKAEAGSRLAALAGDLIQFGNPFVVAVAILYDSIRLPIYLDRLCRWLVHRDSYGCGAWPEGDARPDVDSETLDLLDSAFVIQRRDSRYLHAAWELVSSSDLELAKTIRERFLGEFPQLLQAENPIAISIRDGFRPVPPLDDPLRRTMRFALGKPHDHHRIALEAPFEIARTPVTNAQFELFAPDHRQRRTQWSVSDACPVVVVSWYEAQLFCEWLANCGGKAPCRLPTESEWEIACRAGCEGIYCRIRKADGTLCDLVTEDDLRLVAHFDSMEVGTSPVGIDRLPNARGLFDMLGNVWEWCDRLDSNLGTQVNRGGSWFHHAWYCCSASLGGFHPSYHDSRVGFRLARCLSDHVQTSLVPVSGAWNAGPRGSCVAESQPLEP